MKVSLTFLTVISMMVVPSSRPEIGEKTAEITNASWQVVPDTDSTTEGYTDPAYIDINSINQKESKVVFDVVNPDASYGRLEGNCQTNQIRSQRMGYFLSKTQVSYITLNNQLWSESNEYQLKLLKFVCNQLDEK